MNQNLAKDRYEKSIKIEQELRKAISEIFPVKIGQTSVLYTKEYNEYIPGTTYQFINTFTIYSSNQREDIATVPFTSIVDCLRWQI